MRDCTAVLDSQAMHLVRLGSDAPPLLWKHEHPQFVLDHSPSSCWRQMPMPTCSATGVGLHPRTAWRLLPAVSSGPNSFKPPRPDCVLHLCWLRLVS